MGKALLSELPISELSQLIYERGIYIGKLSSHKQKLLLYIIDDQYAEIRYDRYRRFIDTIRVSTDPAIAHPYLSGLDLRDLLF